LLSGEDSQEGNTVPSISDNASMSTSDSTSEISTTKAMGLTTKLSSPPPGYFLGYYLPPGHPCNSFTLPPPPADKKRTGPRRKFQFTNLMPKYFCTPFDT